MDIPMKPIEALTGFLDLPGIGKIRLDFLITFESDAFYIRCLDFGIMSWGETVEECKADIQEAILIYLEDLPEGQGLFNPELPKYWQMFYELRYQAEQKAGRTVSAKEKQALQQFLEDRDSLTLQYA
jgi:predicted RNase H-like HicB family nuclease